MMPQEKPRHPRWAKLAPLANGAEVSIGIVSALLMYMFDAGQAGLITGVMGALVNIARLMVVSQLQDRTEAVERLARTIDLATDSDVAAVSDIARLYLRIQEQEFHPLKDSIISETSARLAVIANNKRSDVLTTSEYYGWLLPTIEAAGPGTEIWAVSMMLDCEWDESEAERRFLTLNMEAVGRGASVTRAFVIPETVIQSAARNPAIQAHLRAPKGLRALAISREQLTRLDLRLCGALGDGLCAIDRRVALIDSHSSDGSARGIVTMNGSEITAWRRNFDNLLNHCAPLARFLAQTPNASRGRSSARPGRT